MLFRAITILIITTTMLTSCYSYSTVVGEGAQGSYETKRRNHYLFYGIVPVGVSNPSELSKGAKDYTVTTKQTFFNGFMAAITFGIYAPTTTSVIK